MRQRARAVSAIPTVTHHPVARAVGDSGDTNGRQSRNRRATPRSVRNEELGTGFKMHPRPLLIGLALP
eukprot:2565986-Alexandrium_andersonii.AAC.1